MVRFGYGPTRVKSYRYQYCIDKKRDTHHGVMICKNAYCLFRTNKFEAQSEEFRSNFIVVEKSVIYIIVQAKLNVLISFWDEYFSGLLFAHNDYSITKAIFDDPSVYPGKGKRFIIEDYRHYSQDG
jgi:hypothetical protein